MILNSALPSEKESYHWVKSGHKWATTWQNQQNECVPSEDSDQPGQSLLCIQWVAKDPRFLQADSKDADQTEQIPRLIRVFAGRTVTLLVISWQGSNVLG